MSDFVYQRRIEFSDTDMGGMVHFARFFVFMEIAEHAFLRELGADVDVEIDGRRVSWPRVAASCDFKAQAHFNDVLDIHVEVVRKGEKSMTYGFVFKREDTVIAHGQTTAVCCELDAEHGWKSTPIPDSLAELIDRASK